MLAVMGDAIVIPGSLLPRSCVYPGAPEKERSTRNTEGWIENEPFSLEAGDVSLSSDQKVANFREEFHGAPLQSSKEGFQLPKRFGEQGDGEQGSLGENNICPCIV